MNFEFLIAAESASSDSGFAGLFSALGLNVQTLVLNTLAFLVVVWIMAKWVFPPLTRALDAKKDELESAVKLEQAASGKLDEATKQANSLISAARKEADAVLAATKADAHDQLEAARVKAADQATRIVDEARAQLARDVVAARQELRTESARLVAAATEAVLDEKLNEQADAKLITRSLERQ